MIWIVVIVGSLLIGGLCALKPKRQQACILATLIPWTIFLMVNLYGEHYSPDKEIMQGTWLFFQLTIGSLTAILGYLGAVCTFKLKAR